MEELIQKLGRFMKVQLTSRTLHAYLIFQTLLIAVDFWGHQNEDAALSDQIMAVLTWLHIVLSMCTMVSKCLLLAHAVLTFLTHTLAWSQLLVMHLTQRLMENLSRAMTNAVSTSAFAAASFDVPASDQPAYNDQIHSRMPTQKSNTARSASLGSSAMDRRVPHVPIRFASLGSAGIPKSSLTLLHASDSRAPVLEAAQDFTRPAEIVPDSAPETVITAVPSTPSLAALAALISWIMSMPNRAAAAFAFISFGLARAALYAVASPLSLVLGTAKIINYTLASLLHADFTFAAGVVASTLATVIWMITLLFTAARFLLGAVLRACGMLLTMPFTLTAFAAQLCTKIITTAVGLQLVIIRGTIQAALEIFAAVLRLPFTIARQAIDFALGLIVSPWKMTAALAWWAAEKILRSLLSLVWGPSKNQQSAEEARQTASGI